MRHRYFELRNEPYVEAGSDLVGEAATRQSKIEDAQRYLVQNRDIIAFLVALRKAHLQADAEQFAKDLFASGFGRR